VAARHALRLGGWLALPVATTSLGAIAGPIPALIGLTGGFLALLYGALWLPRAAHSAFDRGRHRAARRRYRLLGATAVSAVRERAALLSRIGCLVAEHRADAAEQLLARIDVADLDAAERAVWLNNRACLAIERDPAAALALIEEASALRPDVAAVQHTRAQALLGVGRLDEAIAVLDALRSPDLPRALEADRCRDLARAWERKGQPEYAADYAARAQLMSAP